MRTTPSTTYDPLDLIPTAWSINFVLIDANTPVLSPLLTAYANNLKPTIITTELKPGAAIDATDKYLAERVTLVIMNP
jgi:hypothetical protein